MEVKPGYKQTEVGVIPEEWEVRALESVARIIDPQPDHRTPPETAAGEPYIGISDFIDDETVDWDSSRKIVSRAVDKQQLSFQVGPGNIIFGKIGTIGSPKFLPTVSFRFGLSANVLLIQPRIESNFVMAWLRSSPCQRAVRGELHSTSQAAFGINKMRRVMIPVPPDAEQRAIAEALSDVDGLLGGLDRLIAKKRDLKQAAMQQLLTGQTRLPGFHGEWEETTFGSVVRHHAGNSTLIKGKLPSSEATGRFPAYSASGQDVWCDHFEYEGDAIVVSAVGSRCGKAFKASGRWCAIANTHVVWPNSAKIDTRFLAYFINDEDFWQKSGTGQPFVLFAKTFARPLRLPELPEQTAIAEVLSEMDGELAVLEQRREKTRALKQAMMQELLTGRTRLVGRSDGSV